MPWKRNSSGRDERFDYLPIGSWSSKQTLAEKSTVVHILKTPMSEDAHLDAAELGWMRLIDRLPPAMHSALHAELINGNMIIGIEDSDWPVPRSIIVYMQHPFTVARRYPPDDVTWQAFNDPHYWKQNLKQEVDGRVFLAIW